MICQLTGMEVSNASMYDGATAVAEAILMACQATRRSHVVVARNMHPEYRQVVVTYTKFQDIPITEIGYRDGMIDMEVLEKAITDETAAVVIQSPNFLEL